MLITKKKIVKEGQKARSSSKAKTFEYGIREKCRVCKRQEMEQIPVAVQIGGAGIMSHRCRSNVAATRLHHC